MAPACAVKIPILKHFAALKKEKKKEKEKDNQHKLKRPMAIAIGLNLWGVKNPREMGAYRWTRTMAVHIFRNKHLHQMVLAITR